MEHENLSLYITNLSFGFTKMAKLTFSEQDLTLQLKEGTELIRLLYLENKIPLRFGCCEGKCGTCTIKVLQGKENLSPLTKQEKQTLSKKQLETHRLACQCALTGDVVLEV